MWHKLRVLVLSGVPNKWSSFPSFGLLYCLICSKYHLTEEKNNFFSLRPASLFNPEIWRMSLRGCFLLIELRKSYESFNLISVELTRFVERSIVSLQQKNVQWMECWLWEWVYIWTYSQYWVFFWTENFLQNAKFLYHDCKILKI